MPLNEKSTDFVTAQLLSTCNYRTGIEKFYWLHVIISQICFGFLNHQIEHHLFPQMSVLNYPLIQNEVKLFCKEHKLIYHNPTFLEAVYTNYQKLNEVALIESGLINR